MDAVTRGTLQGVALVPLVNLALGLLPHISGQPVTLQRILGMIMAPERRDAIVALGLRSIVSGTLAPGMTGAVVWIVFWHQRVLIYDLPGAS